ncbi:hypothetical protein Hanom_Chr03g00180981 [Helianthus anomalus]
MVLKNGRGVCTEARLKAERSKNAYEAELIWRGVRLFKKQKTELLLRIKNCPTHEFNQISAQKLTFAPPPARG